MKRAPQEEETRQHVIEAHCCDIRGLTALLVAVTSALSVNSEDAIEGDIESIAIDIRGSGAEWLDHGVRFVANKIEERCAAIESAIVERRDK